MPSDTKQNNQPVWVKGGNAIDPLNLKFCAGRDVHGIEMADLALLPFDIWVNLSHARMLFSVKILSAEEWQQLQQGLLKIQKLYEQGKFTLDSAKEDVHMNIESYLTETLHIPAAQKLHTARSRNDQVATGLRLVMRSFLFNWYAEVNQLVAMLLEQAEQNLNSWMPGFTHHQPAMWTTWAHWLTHWRQGLLRSLERMVFDLKLINRSPLGAAAGFGTSWNIDRELTAKLLGFDGVDSNTLDCISSRGELEAQLVGHLCLSMNQMSQISQDLIMLSHPYFGMLKLDPSQLTGSSIMPQKQNPDFAEVIKAKTAACHGLLQSLLSNQKAMLSGYNRDSQYSKYFLLDAIRETKDTAKLLSEVLSKSRVNKKAMQQQGRVGNLACADLADWLAQTHHLPFRQAYKIVGHSVNLSHAKGLAELDFLSFKQALQENDFEGSFSEAEFLKFQDPKYIVQNRQHIGAPSPESVKQLLETQNEQLKHLNQQVDKIMQQAEQAKQKAFAV